MRTAHTRHTPRTTHRTPHAHSPEARSHTLDNEKLAFMMQVCWERSSREFALGCYLLLPALRGWIARVYRWANRMMCLNRNRRLGWDWCIPGPTRCAYQHIRSVRSGIHFISISRVLAARTIAQRSLISQCLPRQRNQPTSTTALRPGRGARDQPAQHPHQAVQHPYQVGKLHPLAHWNIRMRNGQHPTLHCIGQLNVEWATSNSTLHWTIECGIGNIQLYTALDN
jgi:hypothetical protein